jgi:signal transduction histidine kinase
MSWHARASAWSEAHRFPVDVTWTVFLGVPGVALSAQLSAAGQVTDTHGPLAVAMWATLLIAPLAWRRVRPVGSTAAVALAAAAHVIVGGVPLVLPADIAILIALWSVTVYGPAWAHRTAIAVALAGAGLLGFAVLFGVGIRATDLNSVVALGIMSSIVALAVWSFGLVRRARFETLNALRDRAHRLELERDQQATIATAAERARIAREMHDIVAHSLSVIIAQADGGRYAAATNPDAAAHVLEVVAETGRAALADMRRLLGVLRSDDGRRGPGGGPAPLAPQPGMSPVGARTMPAPSSMAPSSAAPPSMASSPAAPPSSGLSAADGLAAAGLTPGGAPGAAPSDPTPDAAPLPTQIDDAELGSLVDQARDAGMAVSLVRVGEARRLPPGAGLTLHRICQESLTNVRKHGGPGVKVTVVVRWGAAKVELEVSDDGRGAAAADDAPDGYQPGYGLLGMRERAAMFGGQVTAGPKPGGGWRVRFTMPLPS